VEAGGRRLERRDGGRERRKEGWLVVVEERYHYCFI
jgi:hypothetical protein